MAARGEHALGVELHALDVGVAGAGTHDIVPSAVVAVTSSVSGTVAGSIVREW